MQPEESAPAQREETANHEKGQEGVVQPDGELDQHGNAHSGR